MKLSVHAFVRGASATTLSCPRSYTPGSPIVPTYPRHLSSLLCSAAFSFSALSALSCRLRHRQRHRCRHRCRQPFSACLIPPTALIRWGPYPMLRLSTCPTTISPTLYLLAAHIVRTKKASSSDSSSFQSCSLGQGSGVTSTKVWPGCPHQPVCHRVDRHLVDWSR